MEDLKKRAKELMDQFHLMNIATQDDGGLWVCTVHYVSDDDLNIYWFSNESVRHSKAVLINNKIAGNITLSTKPGDPNLGLQFEGTAEKLEGNHPNLAEQHFAKRGKPAPPVGEMEKNGSWYKITPKKIQIIDEAKWGWNKESIDM